MADALPQALLLIAGDTLSAIRSDGEIVGVQGYIWLGVSDTPRNAITFMLNDTIAERWLLADQSKRRLFRVSVEDDTRHEYRVMTRLVRLDFDQ